MCSLLGDVVNNINSRLKEILEDNFEGWTVTTREGYEVVGYIKNKEKIDRYAISVILSYTYENLERIVKKYLTRSTTMLLAVDLLIRDSSYKIVLLPHPLFFFIIITNNEGLKSLTSRRKDVVNIVSDALSMIFGG